ncbi:MAG: tetratricopeptide repeat protein [Proteobacteria bacterium]|nr:tetratricopeptide repeat protein [Pseudomonadota bacterium]
MRATLQLKTSRKNIWLLERPNVTSNTQTRGHLSYSGGAWFSRNSIANQIAEAEPLFKRALAIVEKALGPEHPNVATSLENYAELLRNMNRKAEAARMEDRAETIRAKHAEENPTK